MKKMITTIGALFLMVAFSMVQGSDLSALSKGDKGHFDGVFGSNYKNAYIANYISEFKTQREDFNNIYKNGGKSLSFKNYHYNNISPFTNKREKGGNIYKPVK